MVSEYYEPYVPVVIIGILVIGLAGIILLLNRILGPQRMTSVKAIPYESGVDPTQSARHRFSVKFYMTAILFLVFDLEVVFIYPWAAKYKDFLDEGAFGAVALGAMLVFLVVLGLGLLYEWRRGSLNWE